MVKIVQTELKVNSSHEINAQSAQIECGKRAENVRLSSNSLPLLDTLADLVTDSPEKYRNNLRTLEKRARAKYLTRELVLKLIDLDSPLKQSYWNTWHCSDVLLQDGKKITAKYCNNSWCLVCNRIRTAKLIKGYLPELKKMDDPRYVTLTFPNVPATELKAAIDEMIREIARIKRVLKKREGIEINGLRHLECTYNEIDDTYHPHFHVLIDGREVGGALIREWLKRYPGAEEWCQDNRPADENDLVELCKYSTKMFTRKQTGKEDGKKIIQVNVEALDVINQALYRRRILQPMGWVKKVSEDVEELEAQVIEDVQENIDVWSWEQEVSDWVNSVGELLTGCEAYKEYEFRLVYFDSS
jgi:Plasmid rolling circle replication initiator protein and truncated derivatives